MDTRRDLLESFVAALADGRETEPTTVYVDGFTGALYLDKPHEVERYANAFENIWGAALDEPASLGLISKAAEELRQ